MKNSYKHEFLNYVRQISKGEKSYLAVAKKYERNQMDLFAKMMAAVQLAYYENTEQDF